MSKNPKFIQITTGIWRADEGGMNHNLYGLDDEGKVYQFYAAKGWKEKVPSKKTYSKDEEF